ncbi:MAG: phosphate ABC transporter permease PstA [Spirochaetaceae bacterium]|jgi:phosphate transport system permease protein|nr:phosphate ABC transporter permease PstA [Spirochaetaceae bacterium]
MSDFKNNVKRRYTISNAWNTVFTISTVIAVLMLVILLLNIINGAFGYVAIKNTVEPVELIDSGNLDELNESQMVDILKQYLSKGLIRRYNSEKPLKDRSKTEMMSLLFERIIEPRVDKSWNLSESILGRNAIKEYVKVEYPGAIVEFRSWLSADFLMDSQASVPELAGIRSAILGSLMIIVLTIIIAFPIGVGAAIYLEEYTVESRFSQFIQVNIYNLSGVPSIIYGLLGLAVFVRGMEPFTSGAIFGYSDPSTANGRTILAAGLTLALLILPIIIINAQEALRAVPQSMRLAGYGIGATKWQTIWSHVLPYSMDRILTGTILAVSRAIGETAPIVVIGASTFISVDPSNIFSKFTTLPIQIYQWTARPQPEFRNVAAAAILMLLIMLLTLNGFAIITRNQISKKRRAN